jgi:hypothetical protein
LLSVVILERGDELRNEHVAMGRTGFRAATVDVTSRAR